MMPDPSAADHNFLMLRIVRTDSNSVDFIQLVKSLDAELAIRDGEDHAFYAQFNKLDKIRHVIVAYKNGHPVGCGAIKAFAPDTMEIKRMYVAPAARNAGVAAEILSELEKWTVELSCTRCILETGKKQPEALALYRKGGYQRISNYGQYAGVENSLCFEKKIPVH
jgi:putative acetyltransferase